MIELAFVAAAVVIFALGPGLWLFLGFWTYRDKGPKRYEHWTDAEAAGYFKSGPKPEPALVVVVEPDSGPLRGLVSRV